MTTSARLLFGITILGITATVASTLLFSRDAGAAQIPPAVSSPLVGIVEGQRAHLTLANVGGKRNTNSVCDAMLAFVDDEGRLLKQQAVRLFTGESTFLALDWSEGATANRARLHYRATFTPLNDGCTSAIAGHEMVDNATDKTTVFIGVYEE